MKLARAPGEFLRAPIGRCVGGRTYLMWCATPDFVGTIQWGALDEQEIRQMFGFVEVLRHPDFAPTGRLLMDCRGIVRADPDVLVVYSRLAGDALARWGTRLERMAMVVPEGFAGISLAGPLPLLAPPYPFRFAVDLDEALAFLDHPVAREAHAAAFAIAGELQGTSRLVGLLSAVLRRDLVGATVERGATALHLSTRTLQRELGQLGTSFSDELRRARVEAARELLLLGDAKIEAVAARVGFGSASRMSKALRRELGVTATELRARR